MNKSILIVDDDRTERRLIAGVLRRSVELNIKEAENGREALRIIDKNTDIALIILDVDMPIMGGIETLEILSKNHSSIPVIVLTGETQADIAVHAMKLGATDFLSKPVEGARLDVSARNALKMSLMCQEISRLKRQADDSLQFSDLIGYDNGLKDHIKTGRKAAACDLPVLITGETGTGKELFARSIHGEGKRSGKNFIAVNCGAIPEKLVESTLFGHEKGSFTGAVNKVLGKFQEASGGTIFLDEVGDLPMEAQVKLLRVLQEGEVEPVGAGKPVSVDVRVISATHRDLAKDVRDGLFREDLYFRLNVLHINILPLRDRKSDIPLMADYFIEQFCASHSVLPKQLTKDALQKLQSHNWPGNVRELENTISRAMALCDENLVQPDDFSFMQSTASNKDSSFAQSGLITPTLPDGEFKSFKELEQEIITLALAHYDGNVSKTARILGIAKSTLYAKMENLAERKSA